MSNPFQIYFFQREKNLFKNLHDFELKSDEVSLHDLRVELKKMSAIISFLRTVYPKRNLKKTSQKIKTIFHETGEIREYQLLQQWLIKNKLLLIDQQYLPQYTLKNLTDDFHQHANVTRQILKELINETGKYVKITHQRLATKFAAQLHIQLTTITSKQLVKDEWHTLRKLIKLWMYAQNWIRNDAKTNVESGLLYYDKLQEAIGYWHDTEVMKETLFRKQIYLSKDLEVQKDFAKACTKLNRSIRYREKKVGQLLIRKETSVS